MCAPVHGALRNAGVLMSVREYLTVLQAMAAGLVGMVRLREQLVAQFQPINQCIHFGKRVVQPE